MCFVSKLTLARWTPGSCVSAVALQRVRKQFLVIALCALRRAPILASPTYQTNHSFIQGLYSCADTVRCPRPSVASSEMPFRSLQVLKEDARAPLWSLGRVEVNAEVSKRIPVGRSMEPDIVLNASVNNAVWFIFQAVEVECDSHMRECVYCEINDRK